jgi:fructuronate reductase/mannitol 2-dehydrogenase
MTLTTIVPSTRTLAEVVDDPAVDMVVPSYDRARLQPGVVHIGVGGFHRAHQAVYLDELAQRGETGWGLVGVGLHRPEMKQVLSGQDSLYTVVERGAAGERARIIGVIVDYLYAPEQPGAVLAALTDPRTKLVTLTVTGAGYPVDVATGEFYPDNDDEIADDLLCPDDPASVFGFIVEALRLRRRAGVTPFTVLSCDNIAQNGLAARAAVLAFARARDGELADWIERTVAFPSSMVDRITPATSPGDRDEIEQRLGIRDGWPVITEPFSQWVIEDRFCNERPPLEALGVQFVSDVRPYERMKTRLLNGSHCALGYFGLLLGYERSDEAMHDRHLRRYLTALMDQVIPLLEPVDGIEFEEYRDELIVRFSNPRIKDRLERLAGRGSTKLASYLGPSIADARRRGADCGLLIAAVAAWITLLAQSADSAGAATIQDPLLEKLAPMAEEGDVRGILLQLRGLSSLADDAEVCAGIERAVADIREHGPRSVLRAAVSGR